MAFVEDGERGFWIPSGLGLEEALVPDHVKEEMHILKEDLELAIRQIEELSLIQMGLVSSQPGQEDPSYRNRMFQRAWVLYQNDPITRRAVDFTALFTFGKGVNFKAKNPDVQKVLSTWWNMDDNRDEFTTTINQLAKHKELMIAGELFFAWFVAQDGTCKLRSFLPSEIQAVVTDPEDYRKRRWYRRDVAKREFDYTQGTWGMELSKKVTYWPDWHYSEYMADVNVPEDRRGSAFIQHVHMDMLFGQTRSFTPLQPGLDWAKAFKDFLEDRVTLNKSLAIFAWKKKVTGGSTDAAAAAARLRAMSTSGLPQPAGQFHVETDKENLEPIKADAGGAGAQADAHMLKLQLCAAYGVMEHYLGDPSSGNLATARSMELPQVKMFEAYQQIWTDVMGDMFRFIIRQSIETGSNTVSGVTVDEKHQLITDNEEALSIDIDFPPITWLDVKAYIEGVEASQLTPAQKVKLELAAFGINNVEAEMKAWKDEKEATPAPPTGAPVLPVLPGGAAPAQAAQLVTTMAQESLWQAVDWVNKRIQELSGQLKKNTDDDIERKLAIVAEQPIEG